MSFLQKKGDGWYCTFRYKGRRHYFSVGQVEEIEARSVAAKVDYLMMRVKQGLLHLSAGIGLLPILWSTRNESLRLARSLTPLLSMTG